MREVTPDPTAGQRARDIYAFPEAARRRVDPTDPTYGDDAEAAERAVKPANDPTDARPGSGSGAEMRVLVRRSGRGAGTALPLVIAARPVGHVHGLARGEGSAEHIRVAGSPVGQVIGARRDERRWARRTARGYVVRLRGVA